MKREWPPTVYCHGFSLRKQALLRDFLPQARVRTLAAGQVPPDGSLLMLWGAAEVNPAWPKHVQIIRVEDGFLRSVGLGADLVRPVSWVFDRRGIYFDAEAESDLEWLLQHAALTPDQLQRAEALVQRIIETGLTKYNVGGKPWQRPPNAQQVILVPGQVETDASIRLGAPGINSNLALLQAVRTACPEAYILYKPHPDVVAGLRAEGAQERQCRDYCNEMVTDAPMGELIYAVDEVHVMTSLTGFEALLRNRKVVCYGLPFYSGWGLTEDRLVCSRRARQRTLSELAACALILYPVYISRDKPECVEPEQILNELAEWRRHGSGEPTGWRRYLRWLLRKILRRP